MDFYETFHGFSGIFASIEDGAIAPLRGRYLAKLAREGQTLPRRQDLPDEAFWNAKELKALYQRLGQKHSNGGGDDSKTNWLFGMVIIAFSYRWLSQEHPDPQGFHLRSIGKAIDAYLSPQGGRDVGVENWSTLYAQVFEPLGIGETDHANFDVAVFWDHASLHQPPRNEADQESFKKGLSWLQVWYGHRHTVFWRHSALPKRSNDDAAYGDYGSSGWCFFESCISAVLTGSMKRLDLSKAHLMDPADQDNGGDYYAMSRACKTGREPLSLPSNFHVALRTVKRFTTPADIELVARLYKNFFVAVAPMHNLHVLRDLAWGDLEVHQFSQALPQFSSLTSLTLSGNAIGPNGANVLALACTNLNALAFIQLDRNRLGDEGAKAFVPLVYSSVTLTHLDLTHNGIGSVGHDALRWARYPLREERCANLKPKRNLSHGMRLLVETPQVGAYKSETVCGGISVELETLNASVNEVFCPVFLLVLGDNLDVTELAVFEGACEKGEVKVFDRLMTQTQPISLTPGHLPFPGKPSGLGITPGEPRYLQFDGVGMLFKRPKGGEFMQPSIDTFVLCAALKRLVQHRHRNKQKAFKCIAEIGSGSGFIAKYASLRADPSGAPVLCTAVDIDPKAEEWGRSAGFGVSNNRVDFVTRDGVEWLKEKGSMVDCILSNPPYIPSESECNLEQTNMNEPKEDTFLNGHRTNLFWDGIGMLVWMIEKFAAGDYGSSGEATLVTVISSLSLKSPRVRTAVAEAAEKHGCRVELLLRREVSWKAFYAGKGNSVQKNSHLMATEDEASTPISIAGCEMWVGFTDVGHPRECRTEDGRMNFPNYFWHVLHVLAFHRQKGTKRKQQGK